MPYDYQTGEEWQDGERVLLRRPRVLLTGVDPQTGQHFLRPDDLREFEQEVVDSGTLPLPGLHPAKF